MPMMLCGSSYPDGMLARRVMIYVLLFCCVISMFAYTRLLLLVLRPYMGPRDLVWVVGGKGRVGGEREALWGGVVLCNPYKQDKPDPTLPSYTTDVLQK